MHRKFVTSDASFCVVGLAIFKERGFDPGCDDGLVAGKKVGAEGRLPHAEFHAGTLPTGTSTLIGIPA
jgi:hypothetical protein